MKKTKTKIDISQFMLDKDDERQLKSLDKLSPLSENFKNNRRVNQMIIQIVMVVKISKHWVI